ncbi:MAG TPA: metallophosphoesterase family protein [Chthonomonadaceae bacterium]|nr:metallophosphoesterase family protein [Chthonomonadaceae bacterium]
MIYAVGDIHGQHVMLKAMLAKLTDLPLRANDTVLFLGDYVDRGENSRAVIDLLIQWRQQRPDSIFLRGNHEQLMLDLRAAVAAPATERASVAVAWLRNGGIEALASYGASGLGQWRSVADDSKILLNPSQVELLASTVDRWLARIPDAHWSFLEDTVMEHFTTRYHFVHAGVLAPGQTWEPVRPGIDPRLWIREPFLSSHAHFDGRLVVFGHSPQRDWQPRIQLNKVGLDTGAVYGGPLTTGLFDDSSETATPRLYGIIQTPFARGLSSFLKPIPVDKSAVRRRRHRGA